MGNPSARRLSSFGHHEYTSASAFSPSFGPSSFWVDAGSCLRTRRRPCRRSRRWATQCAAIDPLRLNDAFGPILDSRRRRELSPRRPNPHSFVALSGHIRAFRGFLHGGLSNTCPQAVDGLGAVVVHGQVSDNPRPKRVYESLRSGPSNRSAKSYPICVCRGLNRYITNVSASTNSPKKRIAFPTSRCRDQRGACRRARTHATSPGQVRSRTPAHPPVTPRVAFRVHMASAHDNFPSERQTLASSSTAAR